MDNSNRVRIPQEELCALNHSAVFLASWVEVFETTTVYCTPVATGRTRTTSNVGRQGAGAKGRRGHPRGSVAK